jgi:DNA-binding CsgD family transcriptional regulator
VGDVGVRPPYVSELFTAAFTQSKNGMALVEGHRMLVDINGAWMRLLGWRREELVGRPIYDFIVGGPLGSPREWDVALAAGHFNGGAELHTAAEGTVAVQWAATTEVVSGRRLVLFVALSTSRWGGRQRREPQRGYRLGELTDREREVVQLVALGSTGPEIADELGIAHDTVRTHVRNAMDKVGARSRAHLVAKALGDGLILG